MRAVLSLVTFVLLLVAPGGSASADCAFPPDPMAILGQAPVVFTGVVASVTPSTPKGQWVQDVTVDHVYAGTVTTTDVRVRTARDAEGCGAGKLAVGQRYLFQVTPDADTWAPFGGKPGAQVATDELLAQVQARLGPGTVPPPTTAPAPEPVGYTRTGPERPRPLSRVAAPGAAMVLVGLLGLLVVRRFAH